MISNQYIEKFYEEICQNMNGEYKIILEPGRTLKNDWIEYDQVKWEIEDNIQNLVDDLKKNMQISLEEKILELYKYICLKYVYDANVLYFFRRDDSNPNNIKYIAVDWYGRIIGQQWIENRKKHNRRICYELSRFYAKAINQLIDGKYDLEAVMVGDKDNLHYVVGLTGKDYSVILDQDDFNSIKDLTRIKLNLTINGIHIFRDETNKFTKLLYNYNKDKLVELEEIEYAKNIYLKDGNLIRYINSAIITLNKYAIDAQGFFEYMRHLIESREIKIEKIWKIDTLSKSERRHERCLYFNYKNKTYLLDSIDRTLSIIDINKLDKHLFIFKPEENEYLYHGG